jgi:DNA-binding NarL/FixJ family response regulator
VWLSSWFNKQDEVPSIPEPRLQILALSMSSDDSVLLMCLAQQYKWDLHLTQSPRDAFQLASQSHFEIILCDRNQPGYPWREVMDRLAECSPRSCILLVSHVSGDDLWRSVLQHGGYDVLPRPLRKNDALHAIQAILRFISWETDISAEWTADVRK